MVKGNILSKSCEIFHVNERKIYFVKRMRPLPSQTARVATKIFGKAN